MSAFLSPVFGAAQQALSNAFVGLSGGQLFTYQAGSTTAMATWTDSTQAVQNANPIIFDAYGRLPQEVWLQGSQAYKFVLKDASNNVLGTYDNISGINDTTTSNTEWAASGFTPTYVSATSFTVLGNQTALFTPNRRVQASVSAGIVYGSVASATFSSVTTVVVTMDAGQAIDSGLNAVNVSILNPAHPSVNGAGIAGPLLINAGTLSLPGITLTPDTATGFYRIGTNEWGWAANGSKVLDLSITGLGATAITLGGGSALANYTSWAPYTATLTLVGGSGNTVPTFATSIARWMQIGKLVFVDVVLINTSGGTAGAGTGNVTIALPVAVSASAASAEGYVPAGSAQNGSTIVSTSVNYAASGNSVTLVYASSLSVLSTIQGAFFNDVNNRVLRFYFSYQVD